MRDEYAVFLHQRLLVLVRVDAVCHDARISAAEEAKLLIRVAVMLRAGTQLPDPRDLGVVFRQMALHGYAVFCLQPRKAVHQIVCAGGDKARRQNRLHGPVCFLSLAEPPFRVPQGLIGRDLAQIDRRVAVHVDLADIARQARTVQLLHEKLCGGHVDGGENGCARGRAVQQVVHEAAIGPVRVLQFLIFGFLREGIGIQPFQQLHIHTETAEGKLRRMDMQIGHARQDQLLAIIQHRQLRVSLRQRPEDARDAAVFDDNITVLHADQLVHAAAEAEISLYNKCPHDFVLLCEKRLLCGRSGAGPRPY